MSIMYCEKCSAHVDTDWDTDFLQEHEGKLCCPQCRPEDPEDVADSFVEMVMMH